MEQNVEKKVKDLKRLIRWASWWNGFGCSYMVFSFYVLYREPSSAIAIIHFIAVSVFVAIMALRYERKIVSLFVSREEEYANEMQKIVNEKLEILKKWKEWNSYLLTSMPLKKE